MPRFEPFAALRYAPRQVPVLSDVVCPPYDVISEHDRAVLAARSAHNIVHIEVPRAEERSDPYHQARLCLDTWREAGIMARDPHPSFYGYRMTFTDPAGARRSTIGVLGALQLEPPGSGILPHEHTTPKAKTDRLELLRACHANISPIWVLSPATGLSEACSPPEHPATHALDDDGVRHEVWPIDDPGSLTTIKDLVASAPVLVADGHHRYEVALAYQAERRAAGDGAGAGDHDAVLALVVELADEQLSVQAIHRLVSGLPRDFDLLGALATGFELEPTDGPDATIAERMERAEALAVFTPEGTWLARPRGATEVAATHDLDSSRLDVALSALPDHHLVYQHGWDLASAAVSRNDAQAAVLLRPATVAQIADVSRDGVRMPPKTTFFWPKPRTGLALRELTS